MRAYNISLLKSDHLLRIMDIRQIILNALKQSLIGDTNKIAEGTKILAETSRKNGFCMALMEIIDHCQIDLPVKQAALIQLKNTIKLNWKPKIEIIKISEEQKNMIKNSLVMAMIRCAKNHQLIKLYREVICNVVGFQYENWLPLEEINNKLEKAEDITAILHCIIGICTNFQFCVRDTQKLIFSEFLKMIFPKLLITVQNNIHNSEIVYLSLKIIWKSAHYQMPRQVKQIINNWMQLILLVMKAYSQEFQAKMDQFQMKNTPEFFYFHSKKWATRILLRYIQRHAKQRIIGQPPEYNLEFSQNWHITYGQTFVITLMQQLLIPTTKKIRYFQLKALQTWVTEKPDLMIQYARNVQYTVLIPLLQIKPEDQQLANEDVIEYLRNEDEPYMNFTNLKKAAIDLWYVYLQTKSTINQQNLQYIPGPMFEENLKFIFEKIASDNLVEKQLGMYLLCSMRPCLNRVKSVKPMIIKMISSYVLPQLTSSEILLRARANDVFCEYGKEQFEYEVLKQAAQYIYQSLSQDPSPLVKIKAALSFESLMVHSQVKQLVGSHISQILELYLNLIKQYDLEQIVSSLEYIIADFSQKIGPYAVNLFKYLSQVFVDLFNKDASLSQNEDYEGEVQLAAAGCLKTLSQILETPLDQNTRNQLEPYFIKICVFMFSGESEDYTIELMSLMNTYIFKSPSITQSLWFFFQVIIYFIVGLPQNLWGQIPNLPLSDGQKNILINLRGGNNLEYLENAVPVLRNYITKSYPIIMNMKQEMRNNFFQTFYYLVSTVYKKHTEYSKQQGQPCQLYLSCATNLMIYVIEAYPAEMLKSIFNAMWQFVRINIFKGKSYSLKMVNCQLICVMIWKNPEGLVNFLLNPSEQIINHISQQSKHPPEKIKAAYKNQYFAATTIIKKCYSKLTESHQRKRMILCYCKLLLIAPTLPSQPYNDYVRFFRILLKLIKANCKQRIETIFGSNEQRLKQEITIFETKSKQTIDEDAIYEDLGQGDAQYLGIVYDDINEDEEDDEDYWDEQYHEKYFSLIESIDELKIFKDTMSSIEKNQSEYYKQLISLVPNKNINRISVFIERALQYTQQLRLMNQNQQAYG